MIFTIWFCYWCYNIDVISIIVLIILLIGILIGVGSLHEYLLTEGRRLDNFFTT